MQPRLISIVFVSVLLLGCDFVQQPKTTIQLPAVVDDSSLPVVSHPEYANWSQFPVKSLVVRKRKITNANGEVLVTTRMWLDNKTPEKVFVGSQVSVKRGDEPLVENTEDIVSYPATYRLPKGIEESRFSLPSAKAKETGSETIKIGDKEYKTKIFEWVESNETGPMDVKLWRSDEIPGKIVRQEMLIKGSETKTVEEIAELVLGDKAG